MKFRVSFNSCHIICITNHPQTQWLKQKSFIHINLWVRWGGFTLGCDEWLLFVFYLCGWISSRYLSSSLADHPPWQAAGTYSSVAVADVPEDNPNCQAHLKLLLMSHLLTSHWPKQVTWPNIESRVTKLPGATKSRQRTCFKE